MSYQWPGSFPAPPGMDKFLTPHRTRLHSTQVSKAFAAAHALRAELRAIALRSPALRPGSP